MSEKPKNKERTWFNFGKTEDKIMNFIDKSPKITEAHREKIREELKGKDIKEIFRFVSLSIAWSSIALSVDLGINSIMGSTAIAQGTLKGIHFLPTLLFSTTDYIAKYSVYRHYYGHLLTRWQTAKSAIPTIGPIFLINELFKDSPAFARALRLYINESNPIKKFTTRISQKIKNILGKNNKNTGLQPV